MMVPRVGAPHHAGAPRAAGARRGFRARDGRPAASPPREAGPPPRSPRALLHCCIIPHPISQPARATHRASSRGRALTPCRERPGTQVRGRSVVAGHPTPTGRGMDACEARGASHRPFPGDLPCRARAAAAPRRGSNAPGMPQTLNRAVCNAPKPQVAWCCTRVVAGPLPQGRPRRKWQMTSSLPTPERAGRQRRAAARAALPAMPLPPGWRSSPGRARVLAARARRPRP